MKDEKIRRFCLNDGAQMRLASGAIYNGVAVCPVCGKREYLDCGGSRAARSYLPAGTKTTSFGNATPTAVPA